MRVATILFATVAVLSSCKRTAPSESATKDGNNAASSGDAANAVESTAGQDNWKRLPESIEKYPSDTMVFASSEPAEQPQTGLALADPPAGQQTCGGTSSSDIMWLTSLMTTWAEFERYNEDSLRTHRNQAHQRAIEVAASCAHQRCAPHGYNSFSKVVHEAYLYQNWYAVRAWVTVEASFRCNN